MLQKQILTSVLILIAALSCAHADQYFGVFPGATISDVHNLFPNTKFEELKPIWLQQYQRLMQIQGEGIDGSLAFLFEDELLIAKRESSRLSEKKSRGTPLSTIEKNVLPLFQETIKEYSGAPSKDPWRIDDIRWQPNVLIPLSKLIARYGNPDKKEIREDMKRVAIWTKDYNITAFIESGDMVALIIYRFSRWDWICASRWKSGETCDPKNPFPELRSLEK